jgi:uncharacterized protein (TIGR02246 family)
LNQVNSTADDEEEIRQLVRTWMTATRDGDIERVLELMTDDALFLTPGREPMSKAEFARLSKAQTGPEAPKIEGDSQIQEIQVVDGWAFMWSKLSIVITPPGSTEKIVRSGQTLSVLRKEAGQWRLARDANLLTTQPKGAI